MKMTIKITPNNKGSLPGKLGDAELHFEEGVFAGLKLIGFGIFLLSAWVYLATDRSFGGEVIAYVSVYVPTTSNPTSGYFVMLPRSQVRELDMSVEEALKYVVSMGVVMPRGMPVPPPPRPPSPASVPTAGITARDYAKFMAAFMQASMIQALQKQGAIKEPPKDVNPENVKFAQDHQAEFEAFMKRLEELDTKEP